MKKDIIIRPYQESDAPFLSQIYYHTIHTINAKDYTQEQRDAWAPVSSLNPRPWHEKWQKLNPFVALIDNIPVGFCEFETNGHIDCFYVHHNFQGCGIGKALVKALEKEAVTQKLPRIYAEVSLTAKPFFQAQGFSTIKQQTVEIRGCTLINFVMEKIYPEIRLLSLKDIPQIVKAFSAIGWDKPASLFEGYFEEFQLGERLSWIAFVDNHFAGYVTLKWDSSYAPFRAQSIPEIMDLNVLPNFRNKGIGSKLLTIAEKEAQTQSHIVGLGVGLYAGPDGGYGSAQRLYVERGYIPDGRGITYNYEPCTPGETYALDDDLILWFTKKLC